MQQAICEYSSLSIHYKALLDTICAARGIGTAHARSRDRQHEPRPMRPSRWRIAPGNQKDGGTMLTREEKRQLRAARYRARLLTIGTGQVHVVKRDRLGYFYPAPNGALDKRTKRTSVPIRYRTDTQVLTARGTGEHTKGKRSYRYTTFSQWRGRKG